MVLFAAVASMFALTFSTLAEFYTMQAIQPDMLSDRSITFEIKQWDNTQIPIKNKDLIKHFIDKNADFMVYRNYPISNGKAVLLTGNTSFKPNLVEGRNFTEVDFDQQAPVALIAEELRNKTISKNGKLYYLHENREYQVIGIFKIQTTRKYATWGEKSGALYYVNMAASTNLDTTLNGSYIIDAKDRSMDAFDEFAVFAKQINPNLLIEARSNKESVSQNLIKSIQNSKMVLISFVLTAFLVLLNVFSTTNHWIKGRYKELAVRMLSGGSLPRIRWMMLRDYLLIVTVGYGFGLMMAVLVIKSGIFPFIGKNLYLTAVIAGYVLCLASGALFGWISLTARLNQDIILQIRG